MVYPISFLQLWTQSSQVDIIEPFIGDSGFCKALKFVLEFVLETSIILFWAVANGRRRPENWADHGLTV